ncbi:hypothetical protein FGO68_gene10949 [Halteria grandinella]|uniref:Uncharacterized protein n=1 Tax=Halteria grandinella TaxID=5974 RepID=A0A8J8NFF3_HALGN|nr:hypothetical protein FGO68_gene10949 [Halteria grandinella]
MPSMLVETVIPGLFSIAPARKSVLRNNVKIFMNLQIQQQQTKLMKKHQTLRKCLLCVTNGSEEIETVTIHDTLKRASHIELTFAKVFEISAAKKEGASSLSVASDLKNELSCTLMQGLKIVTKINTRSLQYRSLISQLRIALMKHMI